MTGRQPARPERGAESRGDFPDTTQHMSEPGVLSRKAGERESPWQAEPGTP